MKNITMVLLLVAVPILWSGAARASLVVDDIQIGCGFSDLVYADLASHLNEKSRLNLALKSQGKETGRRLYFFSDNSWFLTFEFFSEQGVDQDISCIAAKGPGNDSEQALNFVLTDYPKWRWGIAPKAWP